MLNRPRSQWGFRSASGPLVLGPGVMSGRFALGLVLLVVTGVAPSSAKDEARVEVDRGAEEAYEVIDMSPDDRASWSLRNLIAPITSIFHGGPGYWYKPRRIEVDTTPPGGSVDLFYVRANFQKRFEQGEAPLTVLLPPRIEAGPRDSLTIRAFREGYRQKSVTLKVTSRQNRVTLDLDPLPNTLRAFSHRYFGGRASLAFLTEELVEFRVQKADDGFTLILNETAISPEAAASLESVRSPLIASAYAQQLGEDLLVKVTLNESARQDRTDLRSRQSYDAPRDLHDFSLDLVPSDGAAEAVARARAALARLASEHITGCAMHFDRALRGKLDAGALSRALTPRGAFTDRYLRAAMRRLGELTPGGVVEFNGSARFSPTVPIELEAALSQAGDAQGYLALLRRFVAELEGEEYRRETLRSLIAPELDAARFDAMVDESERRERDCRRAS